MYKKYTTEEHEIIKQNFAHESKSSILEKLPNRTWEAVRQQGKILGIKRNIDDRKNSKANLEKLTDGSPESFYWLGFLLADGNFRENKAIRCELSTKDSDHLEKFAKYINTTSKLANNRNSTSLSVYSCDIVPKLQKILGLDYKKCKTYNCPDMSKIKLLKDCEILSILGGYIDGDGCVVRYNNKSTYLIISSHVSWIDFYDVMISFFNKYSKKPLPTYSITKQGYLRWCCGKHCFLKQLKSEMVSLNLPLLERKWGKI